MARCENCVFRNYSEKNPEKLISRNPLYLGFILLILSSCLITPNPVNIIAAFIAIALHHMIILREESYLLTKLGNELHEYMKSTGRYLLHN